MAGTSHRTLTIRPSWYCGAGLPSTRVCRGPPSSDLRSISLTRGGAARRAETFQPIDSGRRAISATVAPRSPRPGDSSEIASSTLVLPAPFGPKSATGRESEVIRVARCERKCDRVSEVIERPGKPVQTRIGITT